MPHAALRHFSDDFALSSLGLPGTNSFVGEFLVLAGTFVWSQFATAFAALGVILAAAYMLWLMQRVVFGTPAAAIETISWTSMPGTGDVVPLIVLVNSSWGSFQITLGRMHASVTHLLNGPKAPAYTIVPPPASASTPATPALAAARPISIF